MADRLLQEFDEAMRTPEIAVAVAAITALTGVLKQSQAKTAMQLQTELRLNVERVCACVRVCVCACVCVYARVRVGVCARARTFVRASGVHAH